MRERIYVCECVESGSHVPAPHIHVDQLPKPVEAVLKTTEPLGWRWFANALVGLLGVLLIGSLCMLALSVVQP